MRECAHTPSPDQTTTSDEIESEAQAEGAGFVSTWPWFCSGDICPMVIGHTIAYIDTGHVTEAYASELAFPFARAFRLAVAGARS
jgi:hypothetical protein